MHKKAVITKAAAALLTKPVLTAELADEVFYGSEVEIIGSAENEFYKIKTDYQYVGYVYGENLNLDGEFVKKWGNTPKRVVERLSADVLNEPSVRGLILENLCKGCLVGVASEQSSVSGWTQIVTANGGRGFIRTTMLGNFMPLKAQIDIGLKSIANRYEEQFRKNVVRTAFCYYGVQYRWGGKTPRGIDCSGLAWVSYWLNGEVIYRDASIDESVKQGFPMKKIPFEYAQTGDLLFFPGHVAICIGGEEYIHSSFSGDGVFVNSLNKSNHKFRADLAESFICAGSLF